MVYAGDVMSMPGLGRDPACMVQMPDPKVSRIHAIITTNGGEHHIENRGANGTRINGKRIDAPHKLKPGDAVFIASYILVFQPDDAPAEELASTVLAG